MRYFSSLILLLSVAIGVYSQTPDISLFARPNTVWSVGSYSSAQPPDYPWCVYYFKLCEASSESNVYQMKGGGSYDGYSLDNIDECPVLFNVRITEDSLLYFEYPNENPALIFDYKAQVGDTITLDGFLENTYSVYKIVVCDLDTIENEANQYKMWTIAPAYVEYANGEEEWVGGCSDNYCSSLWFSGIGSECGFHSEYNIYPLPGWTGGSFEVLCAWFNGSMIFHNSIQYHSGYEYWSTYYPRNYCTMEDVEALTGNKSLAVENISISPNPTNNILHIELPDEISFPCEVSVINELGNIVRNFVSNANTTEIDVSELDSGIYFVKAFASGKFYIGKFSKY